MDGLIGAIKLLGTELLGSLGRAKPFLEKEKKKTIETFLSKACPGKGEKCHSIKIVIE